MVAGTSTGSIMTGLLTIPKKSNKNEAAFYINETINLYRTKGKELFKSSLLNNTWSVIVGIGAAFIFASLMYCYCRI